ncbi:MAG: glycosyltransferase family 4 protein [Labrys sp. (in: a-proteobacteria)]|jgi:glycosyltransferase involved in cell wall biosynthesis
MTSGASASVDTSDAPRATPVGNRRILMDVTSCCRWNGPPVGIVRVERALAAYARRKAPDVVFVFFDPRIKRYRYLDPRWFDVLLTGDVQLDAWTLPNASSTHVRFIDRFPRAVQTPVRFLLRFRRQCLTTLETRRLRAGNMLVSATIDRVQRRFMSSKYKSLLVRPDGERRPLLSPDEMLGDEVRFGEGDILFGAGSGWSHANPAAIAELKRRHGVRHALMVYDVLPILMPHCFPAHDVERFAAYMDAILPITDLALFGSHQTRADTMQVAADRGVRTNATAVVPYGSDVQRVDRSIEIAPPEGLRRGGYILFVSTIEPRKGHGHLLKVWRRLLDAGIPQAADMTLVFVGRLGWMIDALKVELDRATAEDGRLKVLSNIDDATLAALYANAAFCTYPSEYEGYGLPIIEAFRYGKAVIASDRGSIPEVIGEFGPSLPATDVDAWVEVFARWITNPSERQAYETAIRERFRPTSWDEAAAASFDAIRTLTPVRAMT